MASAVSRDPSSAKREREAFVVLLAGGQGTRFWPASRTRRPKPFLRLFGDRSLLRQTWERFAAFVPANRILIVTSPEFAAATRCEIPELSAENLVIEPSGRDTAPAIALAMRAVASSHDDPLVLVAPTDHHIRDESAFRTAVETGFEAASQGALVTFGIVPDRPATGFGYIEVERAPTGEGAPPVLRFHEKPPREQAEAYLSTGRFFWNAGIFAWRARRFQEELAAAAPALAGAVAALPVAGPRSPAADEAFEKAWSAIPPISIDFALMEKARNVCVVPLNAGWSDVGSWAAATGLMPSDESGNLSGKDLIYVGSRQCAVHRVGDMTGEGGGDGAAPAGGGAGARRRLYALVGLQDVIVVESEDAVLICSKGAEQDLRTVVQKLADVHREDLL